MSNLRKCAHLACNGACLVLLVGAGAYVGGCTETTSPAPSDAPTPPISAPLILPGKTILPQSDAFLRSDAANKNYGSQDSLRIQKVGSSGANRALIAFNQAAIVDSLAGDSLISATLEVTIKRNGNDWSSTGRQIAAHRMTRGWVEGGVTWNCANDTNAGNNVADCPGNTWSMGTGTLPYVGTPVAQALVVNNQSGTVSFNVTSDVRAFLSGQAQNLGWLMKLANETQTGTVVFRSREGTVKPRLVLSIYQGAVPAQAPSSLPTWIYSDSNVAATGSSAIGAPFIRRIVILQFKPGTSTARRDSAIAAIGGAVAGGVRIPGGEGHYFIKIEDVIGSTLLAKAAQLRTMPQVAAAFVNVGVQQQYRRPHDGTGWSGDDSWVLSPANVNPALQTWSLTQIDAPFAWGCETGSTAVPIAIVDADFQFSSFPDLTGMTLKTGNGTLTGFHGASVAGILGAKGDNSAGMTGVMWNRDARLYDYATHPRVTGTVTGWAEPLAAEVSHAANDGARIINLSSGVVNIGSISGTGTQAQRDAVNEMHWALHGALHELAGRNVKPFIVLSAGNSGVEAYWNGTPLVRDSFPDQVLTVGATTPAGGFWTGSNYGAYVDVVAPGQGVYTFRGIGLIDTRDGTSVSAPFVSGIAGLLLSFDPTLTNAALRKLIIDGATRGNRPVTGQGTTYYIADAYESLKLAAKRTGAPLCGNRLWTRAGGEIVADRGDSGTTVLFTASDSVSDLTPMHGGRKIQYWNRSTGPEVIAYNAGTRSWSLGAASSSDLPSGVALSAKGFSHNADTSIAATVEVSLPADWRVDIKRTTAGGESVLTSIPLSDVGNGEDYICLALGSNGECSRWTNFSHTGYFYYPLVSYPPDGERAYVALIRMSRPDTTAGPWMPIPFPTQEWAQWREVTFTGGGNGTLIYSLDLANGDVSPVTEIPDVSVFGMALTEGDSGTLVSLGIVHLSSTVSIFNWTTHEEVVDCSLELRPLTFGSATETISGTDACQLGLLFSAQQTGGGTAAARAGESASRVGPSLGHPARKPWIGRPGERPPRGPSWPY